MTDRHLSDRFNVAIDAIDRVPNVGPSAARVRQHLTDLLIEHRLYTRRTGQDMPQIRDWVWQGATPDR